MSMVTTLDDFYTRESYMYGGGWLSYERGVKMGTVRVINEVVSVAWNIDRGFWPWDKDRVMWKSIDPEQLRKVDINEKPSP